MRKKINAFVTQARKHRQKHPSRAHKPARVKAAEVATYSVTPLRYTLNSFHPDTPDEKLLVSDLETRDFSYWPGNQGVARRRTSVRRTSKTED